MKRIATFTAVLAASAAAASPAVADDHARDAHDRALNRIDRIDRYGPVVPDTTFGTPAPEVQPGQPTWPVNPQTLPKPVAVVPADDGGSDDSVWLLVGGLVTAGIVGGSAAGIARQRVRARRVAV